MQDEATSEKCFWCGFSVFTEDGLLHNVDICQEPSESIHRIPTSSNFLTDKKFPRNVSCLDFHADLSIGVFVDASNVSANLDSGFSSIFLFRLTTSSELELMFSTPQLKGLFLALKGDIGSFTTPKVLISPRGEHMATLDLTGHVELFHLNIEKYSLSLISYAESHSSDISDNLSKEAMHDVMDISWWTDHVLILANAKGNISMYNLVV